MPMYLRHDEYTPQELAGGRSAWSNIGIVVDDLAAATALFAALGLELEGEAYVEGDLVDRINGLEGVQADVVVLRTPDGNGKVELAEYRSPSYEGDDGPAPANAPATAEEKPEPWRIMTARLGRRLESEFLAGGAGVESDGQRGEVVLERGREVEVRFFEALVEGAGFEDGLGRASVRP
jgi:hypothetical protein